MRKIGYIALFVGAVGLFWFGLSSTTAPKTSAAPIACSGKAFMVRTTLGSNGQDYSQLYEIIRSGNSVSMNVAYNSPTGLTLGGQNINDEAVFPNGFELNGLGYNPLDGYMYAAHKEVTSSNVNDIYRIHDNGSIELVGTLALSPNSNIRGGTFSPDGTYYAFASATTNTVLYTVTGLDTNTLSQSSVPVSQTIHQGDVAYDFTTDVLYAVDNDSAQVYTLDPSTGTATPIAASVPLGPGVTIGSNGVGSLYMTATGELRGYINNNGSGNGLLVSINKTTNALTLLNDGPTTVGSDATSCVPVSNAIDAIKSVTSVAGTSPTAFTVQYSLGVKNSATISNPNIQLVDNLASTFATGSPTINVQSVNVTSGNCTLNSSYNGTSDIRLLTGADTLASQESCTLNLTVNLVYPNTSSVPSTAQLNTAWASSSADSPNDGHTYSGSNVIEPFNVLAVDKSTDTTNFPSTSNGDTATPSPVVLSYYSVDVVKAADTVNALSDTKYAVGYTLVVGNTAAVSLPNVQVSDNLSAAFSAGAPSLEVTERSVKSGSCTINNAFNGTSVYGLLSGTDNLSPGQSCTLHFTVEVTYPSKSAVPTSDQNNVAYASSVASGPNAGYTFTSGPQQPVNALTFDSSSNGSALPNLTHGDTTSPTPIRFTLAETGIGISLYIAAAATVIMGGLLAVKTPQIRRYLSRI